MNPPKRGDMKHSMEALINHFKLYTEGYNVPKGEVYVPTEAPKGRIWGILIFRRYESTRIDSPTKAPGFAHLAAMDYMARGHLTG
jgi:NADH-quinone oxidoreductase subunit D